MKKLSFFAVALMVCLGFSACSSDDFAPNVNSEGLTVVSHAKMVMTFGDGAETRATYTDGTGEFSWTARVVEDDVVTQEGDKIIVASNGQINGVIECTSKDGNNGVFEGDLNNFTPESVNLFYLGGEEATSMAPTIDFSTQTGDVTKFVVLKKTGLALTKNGDGDYEPSGTVAMDAVMSVLNIDLGSTYGASATKVKLTGVKNTLTISLATGDVTLGTGSIAYTLEPSETSCTVCVPAQTSSIGLNAYYDNTAYAWSNVALNAEAKKKVSIDVTEAGFSAPRKALQLWADGPYWAEFNVGATITDYATVTGTTDDEKYTIANIGGAYQWAGTEDKSSLTQADIPLDHCPYHIAGTDDAHGWTKYVPTSRSSSTDWGGTGEPDNKLTLDPSDDAAYVNWGSNWRMPTADECRRLVNYQGAAVSYSCCTLEEFDGSTKQYVSGCTLTGWKVSGKDDYADNSIFLPSAGSHGGGTTSLGLAGYFWSSNIRDHQSVSARHAYYIIVGTNAAGMSTSVYQGWRELGMSVRAVLNE